jgi:hypothetical protein
VPECVKTSLKATETMAAYIAPVQFDNGTSSKQASQSTEDMEIVQMSMPVNSNELTGIMP